jgi:hypothetical protein
MVNLGVLRVNLGVLWGNYCVSMVSFSVLRGGPIYVMCTQVKVEILI